VAVLNINELANSLKPVVLPGEVLRVFIIKEGKEAGQGVAYLDDGTMVVVDQAKKALGRTIEVTVTSVLQTTAGKMIFCRWAEAAGVEDASRRDGRGPERREERRDGREARDYRGEPRREQDRPAAADRPLPSAAAAPGEAAGMEPRTGDGPRELHPIPNAPPASKGAE
jgi:hypothetical protein